MIDPKIVLTTKSAFKIHSTKFAYCDTAGGFLALVILINLKSNFVEIIICSERNMNIIFKLHLNCNFLAQKVKNLIVN